MKILRVLTGFAFILALSSPAAEHAHAATSPAPILAAPEAHDTASFAEPLKARVTDVALDLAADFAAKRLSGTATLTLDVRPGVDEVVLDTRDLAIRSVRDTHGRPLRWTLGAAAPDKGAPLTVALNGARKIVVAYATQPDAMALQWLAPAQTAGKRAPYLFSQGEHKLPDRNTFTRLI